ncbi:MAG TPA: Gldg family protein [Bacillota bacterium]|nr:Gldg family protein [Bacillota bacterium]
MKKHNILGAFKTRKFKYGGFATLLTIIVIAVLIAVNLVVDMIPLRLDLTKNKVYSLSEQTYNILDNLEEDITIYTINELNASSTVVDEILLRYKAYSDQITIDYIDPDRDPARAQEYTRAEETLNHGDLIVESGDKFQLIKSFTLFNYSSQDYSPESLAVEQRVTSGIMFVSGAEAPVVYMLQGHGELALPYNVINQMELENFSMDVLNLVTDREMPEDIDILLINAPRRDLAEEEEEVIRQYLEDGGKAVFLMDPLAGELERFDTLLRSYGVSQRHSYIIEADQSRYYNNPIYLLPKYQEHEITTPLASSDMPLIMPVSQGIEILETRRNTLTLESLLTTSDDAFARPVASDSNSAVKEDGDIDGPFDLVVAVTDNVYDLVANEAVETQLVVYGNIIDAQRASFTHTEGGVDLFLNSLNWLADREQSITIRPKSIYEIPLNISQSTFNIYGAISVILVPLTALIIGLVVWLRRRHL